MSRDRPRVAGGLVPAGAANRVLLAAGRLGLPVAGVWVLRTRGRRTGRVHEVPVIPVAVDGADHLVAPRGTTDWMRNLLAGGGELRRGRRVRRVAAAAVDGEARVRVLTAYVTANRRRNGRFFDLPERFTADDVRHIAHRHPVVRLR
ncbi:MAG: nitroreductase family deazaflavin-dependent oxidoreductase [Thermoleophilia bacterium]|nr:nitroreductase family deazaflavin-dependent oxidoreductase [Thermoleophilia bacterium]